MPSAAIIKALGLHTQPNQLETPPGSLIEASNVIIRRDNVIESRRGFQLYGTPFGTSTDRAAQIMEYLGALIVNYSDKLIWDTGVLNDAGQSIFNTFAGTYNEVVPGLRMKWIEANNNLYFTTSEGIQVISALSANDFTTNSGFIRQAGGIKALDISTALDYVYGLTTGFLPDDSAVAYRVVWGYTDANGNLVLGTPSSRSVIYNPESSMDIRDYMQLLLGLDSLDLPGSYYTDGNYVSTLGLTLANSPTDLWNNLQLLVAKMDAERGTLFTSGDIAAASITSGVASINVISGVGAYGKVAPGDIIYLNGFTLSSDGQGTINGPQTVTGITNQGNVQVTNILTISGTALAQSGPASYFTISDANNVNNYYFWYSNGVTTDPTPGGTGEAITFTGNESSTDIATITASALSGFAFLTQAITNSVQVTNTSAGPSTDATSGTTGFIVTTQTGGTSGGNINITFNTSATASTISFGSANIQSGSFRGIAIPPTPAIPATHNDVQNLQNYLLAIINELQSVQNINLVATNDGTPSVNPLNLASSTPAVVSGGTTLTVTFNTSATNTNPENQFVVGDLISLDGTWMAGAFDISGLQTVATVTTSHITITLGSAVTNGNVTVDTTSEINKIQWFTNDIQATYTFPLTVTTTANVFVTITIPPGVTTNDFFQIYRGDIIQATGTDVLANLVPDDEMTLVYEAFVTQAEINAGTVTVLDDVPDSFSSGTTNLYTNANSGAGIGQAFDIPPVAQDINIFKNYTWYANTRTRQQQELNLIGVQQIINDFNNNLHPSITISNGVTTNTYYFVLGTSQITSITTTAGSTLAASGSASYFLIGNGIGANFYVWYAIGTATDPMIANATGIQVTALAGDTATQIADKTVDALNVSVDNFTATAIANVITVTNVNEGTAPDATPGTSGFTITTPTPGVGQQVTQQITSINAIAGNLYATTGTADYFTLNTPAGRQLYAFWFDVTGGAMTAPVLPGVTVSPIVVTNTMTSTQVASAIAAAVALTGFWTTTSNSNTVTTTTVDYGPTADSVSHVTNGSFTVTTVQKGELNVLLSNSISPSIAINDTSLSLISAINLNNAAEIVSGFYLSDLSSAPGDILLEEQLLSQLPFSVMGSTVGVGNSFSPTIGPTITSITNTAANPTVVTAIGNDLVNGSTVFISGSNSVPSIDGLWTVSNVIPGVSFTIPVDVIVAGTTGSMENAFDVTTSTNNVNINRVYYSVLNQPAAVPILNYIDVGSSNQPIIRIFPLRDSLFIFKADGLYRISGDSPPWTLALFDQNTKIIAADSLSSANNLLYLWSKQGIVTVSEGGAQLISRAIDTLILPVSSNSQFVNFHTATWGTGYDSDNAYYVFTVKTQTDIEATICYRYSNLTNTWTTYDKTDTCGLVKLEDDKLYLGAGDTDFLEQERKSFDRTDYADRQFILQLIAGNYFGGGSSIKVESTTNVAVGSVITQTQYVSVYAFNQLLQKLDLDPLTPTKNFFSTLAISGGANLRTAIVALAAKIDAEIGGTTFSTDIAEINNFSIQNVSIGNPAVITSASSNLQTSRFIQLTGVTGSSPSVNDQFFVTNINGNSFSIPVNVLTGGIGGTFTTLVQDFRDILSCYNIIITLLNESSHFAFKNYNLITDVTSPEAIVTSVNTSTGIVGLTPSLNFVVGPLTVYEAIDNIFEYCPITLGDPVGFKHISEATMMFQDKTFTSAILSFSTDLLPALQPVPFLGLGNGIFGSQTFGINFFGGNSHSAPFRTYVPRTCQRCRYLNIQFEHTIAREKYSVYGVSLTARIGLSSRAYRG